MLSDKIKASGDLFGFQLDDGQLIPFKLLSYKEYKSLAGSLNTGIVTADVIFDYIFSKCVLDPLVLEAKEDQYAGLVQTLGELILNLSGPKDEQVLQGLINQARLHTGKVELQMKGAICRVFPGYTMDKLDELTFPQLVQVFAIAERIMLDSGVIEKPFEIVVPNTEVDKIAPGKGVIKQSEINELNAALGKN